MLFRTFSGATENVPVSIFCYDGQRKLLRVYESYNDMIDSIATSFSIGRTQAISLSTTSLPACKGSDVLIDQSAFALLWPHLDEINVAVLGQDLPNRAGNNQGEISVSSRRTPTPEPIKSARPSLYNVGPIQSLELHSPRRISRIAQPHVAHTAPTSTATSESQRDVEEVVDLTSTSHHTEDPLFDFNDEAPRFEEQSEAEEQDEEEYQAQEEEEHEEERAPTPSPPQPPKKFKPALLPQFGEPEGLRIKKEKPREQTKEIETPTTPSGSVDNTTTSSKRDPLRRLPGAEEDSRFELAIRGPDPNMYAQFKLRGKNSVRKVLAAACKNFELDFERARLVQLVDSEEDGELYTDEIACSHEETMAACGINAHSRLFIKMDSLSEEEDYERARGMAYED
ncbi:hypothetical protein CPB83DRAFT_860780 [Crepidotus variabilis]|uniref:Uncharacterized protein n=1 Tax=Crepidotus variabilis TaxID=179855 RepID=A0A9P6E8M1_9AGAR|nr:hypothetical protein CPB83DRAFT_860780 [Crepidotus variabilis]